MTILKSAPSIKSGSGKTPPTAVPDLVCVEEAGQRDWTTTRANYQKLDLQLRRAGELDSEFAYFAGERSQISPADVGFKMGGGGTTPVRCCGRSLQVVRPAAHLHYLRLLRRG